VPPARTDRGVKSVLRLKRLSPLPCTQVSALMRRVVDPRSEEGGTWEFFAASSRRSVACWLGFSDCYGGSCKASATCSGGSFEEPTPTATNTSSSTPSSTAHGPVADRAASRQCSSVRPVAGVGLPASSLSLRAKSRSPPRWGFVRSRSCGLREDRPPPPAGAPARLARASR
jgi:hypothetical protein